MILSQRTSQVMPPDFETWVAHPFLAVGTRQEKLVAAATSADHSSTCSAVMLASNFVKLNVAHWAFLDLVIRDPSNCRNGLVNHAGINVGQRETAAKMLTKYMVNAGKVHSRQ